MPSSSSSTSSSRSSYSEEIVEVIEEGYEELSRDPNAKVETIVMEEEVSWSESCSTSSKSKKDRKPKDSPEPVIVAQEPIEPVFAQAPIEPEPIVVVTEQVPVENTVPYIEADTVLLTDSPPPQESESSSSTSDSSVHEMAVDVPEDNLNLFYANAVLVQESKDMPDSGVNIENIKIKTIEMENGSTVKPKKVKRKWRVGQEDIGLCFLRACIAELIGTALLILICVGCANSRILGALVTGSIVLRPLYYIGISIGFGFGIGGIVHILSDASGGHVNPAVSFALFLDKRISFLHMLFFIVSQFIGGFLGAGILYGIGNHGADGLSIYGGNSYDLTEINHAQAFFLEAFGTMFLILTILSTINEGRGHQPSYLQPFSIGVAILVIHIWLIPYTNCGINPVRGSVWNIVIGQAGTKTLIFLFGPLLGALAAVPLYNLIFNIH